MKFISATVNETYTDDIEEGIEELEEGHQVILYSDGTWIKA